MAEKANIGTELREKLLASVAQPKRGKAASWVRDYGTKFCLNVICGLAIRVTRKCAPS